jgi:TolB protein
LKETFGKKKFSARRKPGFAFIARVALVVCSVSLAGVASAQDWIKTGTGLGVEKIRIAVPDFKASSQDPRNTELLKTFNDVLWSDLENAGIFEMVSKSFYPLGQVGSQADVKFETWSGAPPNAAMLVFGNLAASGNNVVVQGWLYDVKNINSPQVLGKQYTDTATTQATRVIAHKFADEIIFRLGGGINGIAETQIYYVSARSGHKEIWGMDYDGANQHPITTLGTISLSPHVSPDGSRLAFSSLMGSAWEIRMFSFDLNRLVSFPKIGGTNTTPSWSPDGTKLAFSSSRGGESGIYVVDQSGGNMHRIAGSKGPNVSPVWNRKTGAEIAWASGRTGLPQVYTMGADGTNIQQYTDQGYAVSPAWSPNGQFLVFSWMRRYGPGAPGAQDIYIMDVASKQWVQLTHDGGRNDYPSWSPDGRHIVFQSNRSGSLQIWTMLADGSNQKPLTTSGNNSEPDWSWK